MKKGNNKTLSLSVKKFDIDFTDKYEESEPYVALQSRNITNLSGWKDADVSDDAWEMLVKVTNPTNGRTIYRRAVGHSADKFSASDIMLGHRSIRQLQTAIGSEVTVQPTNWFCYLWHHAQSQVRYPFRIAIVAGLLSLLFGAVSVILSVYQICHCC